MIHIQHKQIGTGALISGTFEELGRIKREVALYLLGFFLLAVAANFVPYGIDWAWFPAFLAYFGAQYYLYRTMLERGGETVDPRFKVFSFFFMAALLSIPLYFGFSLFVIPGLLLASKWIMAPAFLVGDEVNMFEALGESWRKSETNLVAIMLAFTVMCIIWLAVVSIGVGVSAGLEGMLAETGYQTSQAALEFMWPFFHALPLMLMGLSVTAYRALNHSESDLVSVFE